MGPEYYGLAALWLISIVACIVIMKIFMFFIRRCPLPIQLPLFVAIFTLLFTPSVGPATIVAVPVPLGFLIIVGLVFGGISEVPSLIFKFWEWYLMAILVTSVLAIIIGKRLLSNQSKKAPASQAGTH